jgi:hypothetical protein
MARLRDGTDLIRIGQPARPEMAAWRYGDQFGRRRRRHVAAITTATAGAAALYAVGIVAGGIGFSVASIAVSLSNRAWSKRVLLRADVGGVVLGLSGETLSHIELRPNADTGYELRIPIGGGATRQPETTGRAGITLRGREALSAARVLLPHINSRSAGERARLEALDLLEGFTDANDAFTQMATVDRSRRAWWRNDFARGYLFSDPWFRIGRVGISQRLCLEMILHEEDERLALEGELSELEDRWREAEEIARISDELLSGTRASRGS